MPCDCEEGFWESQDDGKCWPCEPKCLTCSGDNNGQSCSSCRSGLGRT